ncbi:sel1 repeat family protein [Dactylosporangium vinaceum]|uniref:Tetratricopeptide repeat protein n=1 Tax=Dactylosporangium vinaceum TaxID=53362 RepID=A0ABV5M405_9ACTN|nr:tetratricopeptide repeat protein [Dactylosporangium vinaceum]UAB93507.1 sel1 repeat family protein [Dactylosporangium vinaceum]
MIEDDYVELAHRINRGDLMLGILPLSAAGTVVAGLSAAGTARAWRELGICYLGTSGDVLPPAPWSPDLPFADPADHPQDRALRSFAEAARLGDHEGAVLFARCARGASVAAREAARALLRPHARADGATAYQYGLLEQWLDRPGAAIEHHLWAAAQGDADAAFELYVLFATGTGVERDDAESARWLQRAADLGQDRALYNLGAAHATGNGAPLDPARAVAYYERAAKAGNARAAATLGVMYLTGEGVEADRQRAAHWLDEADDLDHPVDEWLAQLGLSRP